MKKIIVVIAALATPFFIQAQNIFTVRSVSDLNRPELTWYTVEKNLKPGFETYRARVGSTDFSRISTLERTTGNGDTLFFHVTDTTLTVKGLYQYFVKARDQRDTAVLSEVMYGHNMGSLPSPEVTGFTAKSAAGKKVIELNWKLNYSFTVKVLALFRSRHYDKGFELVAILPADTNHYTDLVTVSNEAYFYFIQVRDFFGYQLPSVVIHGICTYAEKGYPPQDFQGTAERETVLLSWKTVGSNITGYRIYKSYGGSEAFYQVCPMIPLADSIAQFTDTAVHAPGKLLARYFAVTVSDGNLESNPTDTLSVLLPWNIVVAPPEALDFTLDSAGSVILLWTAAQPNSGVAGYNVYRAAESGSFVKLNASLIPLLQNTWTDPDPGFGIFRYAVESVQAGGKPSLLRTTVTAERPLNAFHLVVSAEQSGGNVALSWTDPAIAGLDALYIYRKTGNGPAELKAMVKPDKQTWTDAAVPAGTSCIYTVVGELKSGARFLVNDGVLVVIR